MKPQHKRILRKELEAKYSAEFLDVNDRVTELYGKARGPFPSPKSKDPAPWWGRLWRWFFGG